MARVRLDKSPNKSQQDLLALLEGQPEGLAWETNLGIMDVFPASSGKEAVARYLWQHFDGTPETSFMLCDDANDLSTPLPIIVVIISMTIVLQPCVQDAYSQMKLIFAEAEQM